MRKMGKLPMHNPVKIICLQDEHLELKLKNCVHRINKNTLILHFNFMIINYYTCILIYYTDKSDFKPKALYQYHCINITKSILAFDILF